MLGKTITLFLIDGNPNGLVAAYLSGWNGQCIKIPRNKLLDAKDRKEVYTSGVYFLFGFDEEEQGSPKVYIGEGDNVYKRLSTHIKSKEFWQEAIVFSSVTDTLTKSHTHYLEKALIETANQNSGYILENANTGFSTTLPEYEVASMDGYIENIKILLPALGYNIFTKVSASKISKSKEYTYKSKGIVAKGYPGDNGFVIIKGSEVSRNVSEALSKGIKEQRENMIETGAIIQGGEKLILADNFEFSSSSRAASFVSGFPVSGPQAWKNNKGKSLKQVEEEMFKEE